MDKYHSYAIDTQIRYVQGRILSPVYILLCIFIYRSILFPAKNNSVILE